MSETEYSLGRVCAATFAGIKARRSCLGKGAGEGDACAHLQKFS